MRLKQAPKPIYKRDPTKLFARPSTLGTSHPHWRPTRETIVCQFCGGDTLRLRRTESEESLYCIFCDSLLMTRSADDSGPSWVARGRLTTVLKSEPRRTLAV